MVQCHVQSKQRWVGTVGGILLRELKAATLTVKLQITEDIPSRHVSRSGKDLGAVRCLLTPSAAAPALQVSRSASN